MWSAGLCATTRTAPLPESAITLDEPFDLVCLRKGDQIARDEKLLIQSTNRILHFCLILVAAQKQPHGWVILWARNFSLPVVQIEVHLPGIAVLEVAHLQLDE